MDDQVHLQFQKSDLLDNIVKLQHKYLASVS